MGVALCRTLNVMGCSGLSDANPLDSPVKLRAIGAIGVM